MQLVSIKAAKKRKDMLEKAAQQEEVYRKRLAKGDRQGAIKALNYRNKLLQSSRYIAYRMTKHSLK